MGKRSKAKAGAAKSSHGEAGVQESMTQTATASRSKTTRAPPPPPPLKVVFVHLDLGIGGAEQLVLQLATASQRLGHDVELVTTRCDDDHCFAAVSKSQHGRLANRVRLYGNWIPATCLGKLTALLSTVRMLWLTWMVCRNHRQADVVVVDVLPTSLPLLYFFLPSAASFFYCHFPDQLLLRGIHDHTGAPDAAGLVRQLYRAVLDGLEEWTMEVADMVVVNSKFTRATLQRTFPFFASNAVKDNDDDDDEDEDEKLPVLYPALDTTTLTEPNEEPKTAISPIVSLNRFERKKNIELLLHAYHYLMQQQEQKGTSATSLPPLIVAGGYDTQNVENVEYRGELQTLADKLGIPVDFRLDISDHERATLFQTALCVVYTPTNEHFGIVPLEAMYAGTPVLAVQSGGPMETILEGRTGCLRAATPQEFGQALSEWIHDPSSATTMGRAGRVHVEQTFGTQRLQDEWAKLLDQTQRRRTEQRPNHSLWNNVGLYLIEGVYASIMVLLITVLMRKIGVLRWDESMMGGLRRTWNEEEL